MKDKQVLINVRSQLERFSPFVDPEIWHKLKAIIDRTPEDQDTCGGQASVEDKIAAFRKTYSIVTGGSGEALVDMIEALNKRIDAIQAIQKGLL